jgi:hypothetical protein
MLIERLGNLDSAIAENRVIRKQWRTTIEGREYACLLAAMFPEVTDSAGQCPAGDIPPWLAYLIPSIDDSGTLSAWPGMVREFARVMRLSVGFT